MIAAEPPLRACELRAAMGDALIGRELNVVEVTHSTNDLVVARALTGAASGLVVFAETQTAGRGQRGRTWESAPRKGLWFSVLLRPRIALADSPQLTTWAAGAIRAILTSHFGIPAQIKPPNDVLVNTRKIAGVLVEMRAQPRASHLAVLGVGVNVNQQREDFSTAIAERATSLAIATGESADRTALALAILRELNASYRW